MIRLGLWCFGRETTEAIFIAAYRGYRLPYDLSLSRVPPLQGPCPFHALVFEGRPTLRGWGVIRPLLAVGVQISYLESSTQVSLPLVYLVSHLFIPI